MILTLIGWLFLTLSTLGIGVFISKVHIFNNFSGWNRFWLSILIEFALLQYLSLVIPINERVFAGFCFLAVLGVIKLAKYFRYYKINWLFLAVSLLAIFLTLRFTVQDVEWYDTYLYHLSAVKWTSEYGVVKGLANLSERLGFNSSIFVFASLLDNWIFSGYHVHIVVSWLSITVVVFLLWNIFQTKDRSIACFVPFLLPFYFIVCQRREINSLSTDLAMSTLLIAAVVCFIRKNDLVSVLIAGLAVTVKLSAVVAFVAFLAWYIYKNRKSFSSICKILLVLLFLNAGFVVRNIAISGWLVYPVFGKFVLPWSLSHENALVMRQTILGWARMPGPKYLAASQMQLFEWFPLWIQRFKTAVEIKVFIAAIVLNSVTGLVILFKKVLIKSNLRLVYATVSLLANLIFIFFTGPDIRFASGIIWMFFALSVSLCLTILLGNRLSLVRFSRFITVLLVVVGFYSSPEMPVQETLLYPRPLKKFALSYKDISGLKVYYPTDGDQCGYQELLCVPRIDSKLTIINSSVSSGFMIKQGP